MVLSCTFIYIADDLQEQIWQSSVKNFIPFFQVKFSSASLLEYLKSLNGNPEALEHFMEEYLHVCRDHQRDDRVSVPAIKTLDHMLGWGVLDALPTDKRYVSVRVTFLEIHIIKRLTLL